MRVVLLADGRFAGREHAMLERLQVGLADEGIRVALALPRGIGDEREDLVRRTIHFEDSGLALSRSWRAAEVAERLEGMERSGDKAAALVHVFGGALWPFGRTLARQLDAALVVEVWRSGLIRMASKLAPNTKRESAVAICADAALASALKKRAPRLTQWTVPWGVYSSDQPHEVFKHDAVWSIMIAGGGLDVPAFIACFQAVAETVRAFPEMLVFVDAVAARRTDLWREADRLGIRSQVSLVDEMDANRDLVLQGDMLVLPEARGEQRTLVLDAMVQGMPIVAARDPDNTALRHDETAILVKPGNKAEWVRALNGTLGQAEQVQRLTRSARAYVAEHHRPSKQVAAVMEAYESVVGKPPIPFPGTEPNRDASRG